MTVLRVGCSNFRYKFESRELAKWTRQAGVNFTNILQAAFCTIVFFAAFMCLQSELVIFWPDDHILAKENVCKSCL